MIDGIGFALAEDHWQMAPGERAAIVGLLAEIRPQLTVELGTAEGGALGMLAHYSGEVHTFDLHPPELTPPPNVVTHQGDYHDLLPRFLDGLVREGRQVEFVLIDGDHRGDGVRRDVEDLLTSDAVGHTCILVHGTMNEEIRRELGYIEWAAHPKIRYVDVAFVQLYQADRQLLEERWGGLGLILVDEGGRAPAREGIVPRPVSGRSRRREIAWMLLAPARRARREIRHAGSRVLRGRRDDPRRLGSP